MNKIPTIEPGIYEIALSDRDDIESVSVTTSVVPKPPPRIYLEIKVVPKPPPGDARQGKK